MPKLWNALAGDRNKMIRVQLPRGKAAQRADHKFLPGEVHFDTETDELRVGNDKGESVLVAKVVEGPHDKLLYAEIPNSQHFVPMCVRIG